MAEGACSSFAVNNYNSSKLSSVLDAQVKSVNTILCLTCLDQRWNPIFSSLNGLLLIARLKITEDLVEPNSYDAAAESVGSNNWCIYVKVCFIKSSMHASVKILSVL